MKLLLSGAFALISLGSTALLPAQTVIQPGQLAAVPNAVSPYSISVPKTSIAAVEDKHDRIMNRLWIASMFAAVAGTSFDAATSWGRREGNSLLASSDGNFGARGLGIKVGVAAAVIVPQICLRKRKDLKGIFAIGNFGEAAIFTGAGVHNLHVR
jgi:hypothetical protein